MNTNIKTREYTTVSEVSGPLMVVEGVEGVGYNEIVDIETPTGEKRSGQVLEVTKDVAVIQVFEGTIIKRQRGGSNETFTVRRVAYGTGVERTFLVNSPKVEKVEIVRHGKVRRAKLYYLRDRVGKATKVKEDIVAKNAAAAKDAE